LQRRRRIVLARALLFNRFGLRLHVQRHCHGLLLVVAILVGGRRGGVGRRRKRRRRECRGGNVVGEHGNQLVLVESVETGSTFLEKRRLKEGNGVAGGSPVSPPPGGGEVEKLVDPGGLGGSGGGDGGGGGG